MRLRLGSYRPAQQLCALVAPGRQPFAGAWSKPTKPPFPAAPRLTPYRRCRWPQPPGQPPGRQRCGLHDGVPGRVHFIAFSAKSLDAFLNNLAAGTTAKTDG